MVTHHISVFYRVVRLGKVEFLPCLTTRGEGDVVGTLPVRLAVAMVLGSHVDVLHRQGRDTVHSVDPQLGDCD